MLKEINQYITRVLRNETESDEKLGKFLLETIRGIPIDLLNKVINDNLQDLLMVIYLTNFAKVQVKVSENLKSNLLNK